MNAHLRVLTPFLKYLAGSVLLPSSIIWIGKDRSIFFFSSWVTMLRFVLFCFSHVFSLAGPAVFLCVRGGVICSLFPTHVSLRSQCSHLGTLCVLIGSAESLN